MARARKPELLELSVTGLGPGERWLAKVRLPLDDAWNAEYEVIKQNGQPIIGELHFVPVGQLPLGGLTARTARPSWSLLIDTARELVRKAGQGDETGTVTRFEWIEGKPLKRQPGRRKRPDLDYARVAAAYVVALRRGSRSPVADVAAAMREQRTYVRDLLKVARDRDLLTQPSSGRAGGDLTEKAKALLAKAERKTNAPATRTRPGARQQEVSPDATQR